MFDSVFLHGGRVGTRVMVACAACVVAIVGLLPATGWADTRVPGDPALWTPGQLGAQLTFTCAQAKQASAASQAAAAGIGGIAFIGSGATSRQVRRFVASATRSRSGVPMLVTGDEEGGRVQRLARAIYRLPSAEAMGSWSPARIRAKAATYGNRMHALGVPMTFGPVADLNYPGTYLDRTRRAFSSDPERTARAVTAWTEGLRRAGVLTVVKHWPGQGAAADSHHGRGSVAPLAVLQGRDLVPFEAAFRSGTRAVMVGHVNSEGLTEPGVPASLSPSALRYLRARIGPTGVIVADSLSMGGGSAAQHLTSEQAAVRSLQAGTDWALVCSAPASAVAGAISAAIESGALPRDQAVESVRRILALKREAGLAV